jgi:hypothetical protein
MEKPMNAEIQVLISELEAARLAQLQQLMVSDIATSAPAIRSLADLQMALTAAKEILALMSRVLAMAVRPLYEFPASTGGSDGVLRWKPSRAARSFASLQWTTRCFVRSGTC